MALEGFVNPRGIVIGIIDYFEQIQTQFQSDTFGKKRDSQGGYLPSITFERELELLIFNQMSLL